MAKTYLEIVNIVLRDLNEIPLTAANFANAVGLQAFIKESVNRGLLDIINYNDEWPWLADTPINPGVSPHTNTLVTNIDDHEYLIPTGIDTIDYENVYIQSSDSNGDVSLHVLKHVDFDEIAEMQNQPAGRPRYVYKSPNNSYIGLYPKPDRGYTIKYVAWTEPHVLVNQEDVLPFPDRFYTALVSRARYYAWMFRENPQQASIALNEYEDNIRRMYKILMLPEAPRMRAV